MFDYVFDKVYWEDWEMMFYFCLMRDYIERVDGKEC